MDDSKNPFLVVEKLKSTDWPTWFGLFSYGIGIFLLTIAFLFSLQTINISFGFYVSFAVLLAPQIVHALLWIIRRSYLGDPDCLTVAFAIETDDSSREYYKEIRKRFQKHLIDFKLNKRLKIKDLPNDIYFNDSEIAEKYINEKGIRLLIWGDTTKGTSGGKEIVNFNIKLSYLYGRQNAEQQRQLSSEIGQAVQRGIWGFPRTESLLGIVIVEGNIIEMSLYALGACLSTVPIIAYQESAVLIFENLLKMLKYKMQNVNFPNVNLVKNIATKSLLKLYNSLLILYGFQLKNRLKAIEYGEKALQLDENDVNAHQNLAFLCWLNGDRMSSERHTKRAADISLNKNLPRINRAFYFMYDRKYEKALNQYRKISDTTGTNILDVITFNEGQFENNPQNPGFLFAAGLLNFRFADKIRGKLLLNDFYSTYNLNPEYKVLTAEIKQILHIK